MTTKLELRNTEPFLTGKRHSLGVEVVDTKGVSPLFLVVPLGDGAGALMTESEFKNVTLKVAKAAGAKKSPDVELSSDYRGIDSANRNRGTIEFVRRFSSRQESFCILLENFTTNAAAGSATLSLQDKNGTSLADDKDVVIAGAKPQIKSFVSTKYNALSGTEVILSWEISPPGGHRLRQLPDMTVIPDSGPQQAKVMAGGAKKAGRSDDFTCYQLEAMLGEVVTDSRLLTLYHYKRTQVDTDRGPGDHKDLGLSCGEILGIYKRLGRLYAVVRDADSVKGASIWWSVNGFDPASWQPLTVERNKKPVPIMIPADAAARPGVVFDDKLYFMGGSSYDANCPGADVGYFSFEANTWVDGEAVREETWPRDMPARMGHGLLASPDGRQLWVIGGYNGDGGALNDIWVYAGSGWTQKQCQGTWWQPRCLFGATFAGPGRRELWIAGGFDSPGGYPTYDDLWRCDATETNLTWRKLDYPLRRDADNKTRQYCGCALATLGDQICALAAYHDVEGGGSLNYMTRISFANNQWRKGDEDRIGSDWVGGELDCYRFDATEWGGCIFVRRLARAQKDKNIHYVVCV